MITSMEGRVIQRIDHPESQINVDHLANGMYNLKLVNDRDESNVKIVVLH